MLKQFFFLFIGLFFTHIALAQEDINVLNAKFEELAKQKKGINEVLKINVSGLTLHDFISSIAEEHQLNIDVETGLDQPIVNNFFDVTVKDVFLHLTQKYDLEVTFMNNIISFKKRKQVIFIEKKLPKAIDVSYNPQNDFLSIKLENDSLPSVAKAIIDKSGKNLVLATDVKLLKISSYILNRPFDQVIEMMSRSNDLLATKDENGIYFIEKNKNPLNSNSSISSNGSNPKIKQPRASQGVPGYFEVDLNKTGFLSVKCG